MISANKTSLGFEPKMSVLMDAVASTSTPADFSPSLGVLAFIPYKPAKFRYLLQLSAAATTGDVTINLLAGTAVIASISANLNGVSQLTGSIDAVLAGVEGSEKLSIEVDVTNPADVGITADMTGYLDIETPIQSSGC